MQYSIFHADEIPLYRKLRPTHWQDYHDFCGITEIKEEFLRKPFSLLFYGPPACGKTTVIELLAKSSALPFVSLSSTETTLEEIRKIIKSHSGTILLFMDEIHRFAKSRQDVFLKPMEEGQVVLLAATTESPWYYLTRPLLSRMRVKEIIPPALEHYNRIVKNIWAAHLENSSLQNKTPSGVVDNIIEHTFPDFRKSLQTLEYAHTLQGEEISTRELEGVEKKISDFLQENRQLSADFSTLQYDMLSAFIKSMRGSDANSAVLYLANLLQTGVEPALIARRLAVFASEDVGLADSQGLLLANAALQAVEKIGMPEARILLSHVTIYLSNAPKSNSAYKAINEAMAFVKDKSIHPPSYILNRSLQRQEYKYPHQFGGYVQQEYWANQLPRQNFYVPVQSKFGKTEENRKDEICREAKNEKK